MKVGDKITCRTEVGQQEGTVVYIHPKGRFFTAAFTIQRKGLFGLTQTYSFRESFPMRRCGA